MAWSSESESGVDSVAGAPATVSVSFTGSAGCCGAGADATDLELVPATESLTEVDAGGRDAVASGRFVVGVSDDEAGRGSIPSYGFSRSAAATGFGAGEIGFFGLRGPEEGVSGTA